MPRRCGLGCTPTRGVLHVFPNPDKFSEQFKAWVRVVCGQDECNFNYLNMRICDRHFTEKDRNRYNRLNSLAVPSLFLREQPSNTCGLSNSTSEQMFNQPEVSDNYYQSSSDKKMAPILYKVDGSPPANAVRMLADIIGLELELRNLDIGNLEHKSSKHVKLNPMGTLPTLVDGDFVISESHATMKYLLSVYGGDKSESLYPSDVRTRALVDQAMFFNVGIYFIRLKVIVLPALFGDLDGPTEKHKADIDEAYGIVEAYLANNEYIVTDHLTIADLSVGATTVAFQYLYKMDTARFPRTAAWLAKLEEHPSFKKILIPGSKILGEVVNAAWQKNKK